MSATIATITASRDNTVTVAKTSLSTDASLVFPCPKAGKFALLVENTANATYELVLLAGTGLHKNQGAKTLSITKSSSWLVGPLSTSRFKSGTVINITATTSFTGNMAVIKLP